MKLIDYDADLKAQLDEVAKARGLKSGEDLIADIVTSPGPFARLALKSARKARTS